MVEGAGGRLAKGSGSLSNGVTSGFLDLASLLRADGHFLNLVSVGIINRETENFHQTESFHNFADP